jgi:hypothetical protein
MIKVDPLTDRKKNAMDAYKDGVLSVEDGTAVGKYLKLGISLPEMPPEKN